MTLVYRISVFFYQLIVRCVAPFNPKARLWVDGRKNIMQQIADRVETDRPLIWVHCASLGEFEQGRPLIEQIRKSHPQYRILLTFFSPSGYEIRKNYDGADYIFYLPADTPANARQFVELVKPAKVFFVKYEYWYFYFRELHRRNIPLYIISAIFRKNQWFFKQGIIGSWYRRMLNMVSHLFVQQPESLKLLNSFGIEHASCVGDTRFDRVAAIAESGKKLPLIEEFKDGKPLLVAGSTWKPDEDLLIQYINQQQGVKFIFAPHEIKQLNIQRIVSSVNKKAICLSEANGKKLADYDVLVIDSIGLLSSVYRYATIAYIGGGFGVGIHNTLEAAIYDIAVLFGPNFHRFNEAVMLKKCGVAYSVRNFHDLKKTLDTLLGDEELRVEIANSCRSYTRLNLGATQKILVKVFNNSTNY